MKHCKIIKQIEHKCWSDRECYLNMLGLKPVREMDEEFGGYIPFEYGRYLCTVVEGEGDIGELYQGNRYRLHGTAKYSLVVKNEEEYVETLKAEKINVYIGVEGCIEVEEQHKKYKSITSYFPYECVVIQLLDR